VLYAYITSVMDSKYYHNNSRAYNAALNQQDQPNGQESPMDTYTHIITEDTYSDAADIARGAISGITNPDYVPLVSVIDEAGKVWYPTVDIWLVGEPQPYMGGTYTPTLHFARHLPEDVSRYSDPAIALMLITAANYHQ